MGSMHTVFHPDLDALAYITFSNNCNETYHFDRLELLSYTFYEQHK